MLKGAKKAVRFAVGLTETPRRSEAETSTLGRKILSYTEENSMMSEGDTSKNKLSAAESSLSSGASGKSGDDSKSDVKVKSLERDGQKYTIMDEYCDDDLYNITPSRMPRSKYSEAEMRIMEAERDLEEGRRALERDREQILEEASAQNEREKDFSAYMRREMDRIEMAKDEIERESRALRREKYQRDSSEERQQRSRDVSQTDLSEDEECYAVEKRDQLYSRNKENIPPINHQPCSSDRREYTATSNSKQPLQELTPKESKRRKSDSVREESSPHTPRDHHRTTAHDERHLRYGREYADQYYNTNRDWRERRRQSRDNSMERTSQAQQENRYKSTRVNNVESNVINLNYKLPELSKWGFAPNDDMTWQEFQEMYELQCRALSVPEHTWAKLIPLYLKEGSLIVYKNLVEKQPMLKDDYDGLMCALNKEFQNVSGASSIDLYSRQKLPNESIGKYYSVITSMAKRIYPDMEHAARDKVILGAFLSGLPLTFKRGLLNKNLKSAEEAFKLAQRYERTNEIILKDGASTVSEPVTEIVNQISDSFKKDQELESLKKSLKELQLKERERAENEDRLSRQNYREKNMKHLLHEQMNWRGQNNGFRTYRNQSHEDYHYNQDNRYNQQDRQQYRKASRYQPRYERPAFRHGFRSQNSPRNYGGGQDRGFTYQHRTMDRMSPNHLHRTMEYSNIYGEAQFTERGQPTCWNCNRMGHLRYDCPQHTTNRRHYDYNDCIDKKEHTDYVQFVDDSDGDEIFTVTGGVLLSGSKDEVPSDECSEDFQRSDDEVFVDDSNVKIIMEIFAREEIEMTGIKYQTLKVKFDARNTSLTEENRWKNEEMNSPVLPVGGFDDQLLQMELQDEAEEILSECVGWLFEEEDLCTPDIAYESLGAAEADMELRDELYNELEVLKLMEDILRVDKRSSKCMYVQETYDNMLDVAYGGINTIEQQQESDIGIGLFLSKSDANPLNFSEKFGMNATMQLSKEQINPSGYQQRTKYSKRMDFIEKRDQDMQTELKGYTPKPDRKSTRLNSSHVKRTRMPSSA